jgi:hypothetical protein
LATNTKTPIAPVDEGVRLNVMGLGEEPTMLEAPIARLRSVVCLGTFGLRTRALTGTVTVLAAIATGAKVAKVRAVTGTVTRRGVTATGAKGVRTTAAVGTVTTVPAADGRSGSMKRADIATEGPP